MASSALSPNIQVTFFGTCPTVWEGLNSDQKDCCIAQNPLSRQIEGHYAWVATGELARQWNANGYREYSAVIEYNRFRIGKSGFGRDRIAVHELRLLNTSPCRDSAVPFVIVTSKNLKRAQETVSRLEEHPRLCKFGLKYMARQGGLKLTAGESALTPVRPSRPPKSLCGARIGVYNSMGGRRAERKNVATIGGVFRIGKTHFALTAAHVFFNNVASTGSWADSGLYVATESSAGLIQDAPRPEVFGSYEIIVESFWPHEDNTDGGIQSPGTSLGLFEPLVAPRRKGPSATPAPKIIWNFEMDWALIELDDPELWGPNVLHFPPTGKYELKPPASDEGPLNGQVLIAAGVSGPTQGIGLGTVGGIMLPWSSQETQAWSVEAEIAVGDCGSAVISPDEGETCGFVVAHDSDTMITYIVPASTVLESALQQCDVSDLPLWEVFSSASYKTSEGLPEARKIGEAEGSPVPFQQPAGDLVSQRFAAKLRLYTKQNVDGQRYLLTKRLEEWMVSNANPNASHLDLLLDSVYSQHNILPIEADKISSGNERCLLVFIIMLELGCGDLIDKFQEYDLIDDRLPFSLGQLVDTLSRMKLPNANILAQQFSENQWAYLPMRFQINSSSICPPNKVIPIQRKLPINAKGGIATLWRIAVHEAFVDQGLCQAARHAKISDTSDALRDCYEFALKSFNPSRRSLFESERSAFRAFGDVDGTIRCLCDYIQEAEEGQEICNLVLEYGELDLDEYFFSRDAPILSKEITQFWKNMLGVASATSNIHQFSKRRAGVLQEYSGLHGDIKPDNILLVQQTFKLADPGFARFERAGKSVSLALGGTRTYDSPLDTPEYRNESHLPAQISQAADIWSLGCVFSLAATWVVMGSFGIEQFDKVRVEGRARAIDKYNHCPDRPIGQDTLGKGNSFHDNKRVLPEVVEWHALLRSCTRRSDNITKSILDLLDKRVLIDDPALRIDIRELCSNIESIIYRPEVQTREQIQTENILECSWPKNYKMRAGVASSISRNHTTSARAPELLESVPASDGSQRDSKPSQAPNKRRPSTVAEDLPEVSSSYSRISSSGFGSAPREHSSESQIPSVRRAGTSRGHPYQDVFQAQEDLKKSKSRSILKRRPPRDKILERYLHNRDLSFLVDNAESMQKHWEEATFLLTTLVNKVKGIDADGIDLRFTTGAIELIDSTRTGKFEEAMRNKRAQPSQGLYTDISQSLGVMLSGYLQHLKKKTQSTRLRDIERGFTVIILTDGKWEGMLQKDAISRTIADFTKSLRQVQGLSLVQRPVSIEFISFGNDEQAINFLERLDHELKAQEITDIIDTTPSTGNVYKMLLGSFLEEYDEEPQRFPPADV